MKSLNRLLEDMGSDDSSGSSPEKIIKCNSCGNSYRVPSYIIDYICQCTRKVTGLDASKLTVNMANMQRDYILKSAASDITIDAVSKSPENVNNRIQVI